MATVVFKKESPYQLSIPAPTPERDELFHVFMNKLTFQDTSGSKKYGFALFGVGRAGNIHLSYLIKNPKVDLLYIIDDATSKWKDLKEYWDLDSVKFLTSAQAKEAFEDPKVRAVVVCSPTFTHEEIVKKALDHKKAVFCEKPVAENMEQTKACYDKAKAVNQPLFSAFNRRFDPAYSSVRNRVREGEIGQVNIIKVCSRDSPLPSLEYLKISGGIFHDCAVHDIDMVLFVLGEYPTRVSVMAKANIPEIAALNDFDTVAIILSFDSGTIGIIDLSRHSVYGYDQRLEVFGQDGMLKVENRQQIHNVEKYTPNSVEKAPIDYSFPSRYARGYEKEMDHFINVLAGKEVTAITANETLAVSRIASACEESATTGKVVEIKWSDEKWLTS